MDRIRKETLKERMEKLDAQEHAQLFELIKRYTSTYTRTESGVLISSDALPNECLLELETMVTYYLDQRKRLESARM
jgi:hypothetical protein